MSSNTGAGEKRRMNPKDLSNAVFIKAFDCLRARPDLPLELPIIWHSIPGASDKNAAIAGGQLKARGIAQKVGDVYVATEEFRLAIESGNLHPFLTK